MKQFTVAILGCGNRGAATYGKLFCEQPDRFRVVALCDRDGERLNSYGAQFSVPEEARFLSEEAFLQEKRADLLVIATMDADHVREGVRALALGYDLLLEKPISDNREELEALLKAQRQYGGKTLVCHVLRYAPAFTKAAEILESGRIGELVAIQALEQVAYWHQAHSFVRGNWRSREETAPMILAKCCHDLDLLQYYARSRCKSVSSVGGLKHFRPECAPEQAQKRCVQCPLVESCAYSAKRIYLDRWREIGSPPAEWPYIQITSTLPLTEQAIGRAIEEGPYGRCVYACDNDVVDHQLCEFVFENGVKATLTMTAFTAAGGRIYKFFGTLGELVLNEEEDYLDIKPFGGERERIAISSLIERQIGHGGGETGLMRTLYETLCGNGTCDTSLEASVESHLMAICAEESRLAGGARVEIHS